MAEDVIIRFRAEVDELTRQINAIIHQQETLAKGEQKVSDAATKATTTQEYAAKKRQQFLKLELQALEALKRQQKLAFDPKTIESFNKKIQESEKRIKLLSDTTKKELTGTGSTLRGIGAEIALAFGAAFSIQQVIAFGKASIDAFLEAEENANKLRFAITQIGQDSEAAFGRLIEQSERLQKATIFSDDAVQQAQAALATFGLTADQIEELIPKLADFASATKTDIVSAANQVGAGLQGMGREFKKFQIEVSASNTQLENYNAILKGFGIFNGAAAQEVETLTGQLKQQENQVGELQERVGEGLAPAWLAVKKAIFETTLAVIEFVKSGGVGLTTRILEKQTEGLQTNTEKVAKAIQETTNALLAQGKSQQQASAEAIRSVQAEIIARLRLRSEQLKSALTDGVSTESQIRTARLRFEAVKNEFKVIQDLFQANERARDQSERALTVEQLRGKSLKELNRLLELNSQLNDIVSKDNVDLIENEIKAREKLAEKAKQLAEETAKKQREENEKTAEAAKKAREKEIGAGVGGVLNFKKIGDDKVKETKRTADEEVKIARDTAKKVGEIAAGAVDKEKQRREELKDAIIDFTRQTVDTIADFYSDFLDGRITEIDDQLNKELSSISSQEEALKTSLDKRIISQSEFTKQQEILQNKRLEAEKKADKETRKLKRQQLIIDKTSALIQIGIDLQQAIASYLKTPTTALLLPVIAGVITAALAAVSAVSIPAFKKGTKGKKGSGMALVGEEGPELTFLPTGAKVVPARQTKAYSELIDAMYDNNVDKYILKQYVAPRLEAQRRQYQDAKDQTFVKNIVNNMSYNGLSLSDQLYANSRGVAIKDKKELAELVGKAVAENIPRPDPWRM